jgi:hypothetical protein
LTIRICRFLITCHPLKKSRELNLLYGGLSLWLERQIKTIKEALNGPEVKGVNIVNIHLLESRQNNQHIDEWIKRINTFDYSVVYDMRPLSSKHPIENVKDLVSFASEILLTATWPQVRAIGQLLADPLTEKDMQEIQRCLDEYDKQWR